MIDVTCNYCGLDDAEIVNQGPDLLLNRPGNFRLMRCRHCGLIYQNPRLTLDELSTHYPEEYQPYHQDIDAQDSAFHRFDAQYGLNRRCRQLIKRHPQPAQLLDVGCATGLFLNAMRQYGWQVTGVELSPYASEYARRTFGLDIITGALETAHFPDNIFDVVTLWDVLEHVIDPKMTLVEIGRILKPGGLLALSLPNPLAFEAYLFGSSWVGWDRPRHLHLFTPTVLKNYLQDTDFHLESIESLGGRLGLTLLSAEMLCHSLNIADKKSQPILRLIYNIPFRLITWPMYRIGELMNRATVMTVFARASKNDSLTYINVL